MFKRYNALLSRVRQTQSSQFRLPTLPLSWIAFLGVNVIFLACFALGAALAWVEQVRYAHAEAQRKGSVVLAELLILAERPTDNNISLAKELLMHAASDQLLKYVAIMRPDGTVVVSTRLVHLNKTAEQVLPAAYIQRLQGARLGVASEWRDEQDDSLVFFQRFQWITADNPDRNSPSGSMVVVVDTGRSVQLALRNLLQDQGRFALVMLLATLLLFYFLSRSLLKPINTLRQSVHRLGQAQFGWHLPDFRIMELQELGMAFNDMSHALRQRMEEIQASENRLRTLIQAAPDAILVLNRQFHLVHANPAALQLFGYEADDLVGQSVNVLLPESFRVQHQQWMQGFAADDQGLASRIMMNGRVVNGLHHSGRRLNLEIGISRTGLGSDMLFTAMIRDVTERLQMEKELEHHRNNLEKEVALRTQELQVQRDRAEAATRAKSEFLANMSHEIRTPMNAVIGMTHLSRRLASDPVQASHLDKVSEAAQHLLGILNDILDFSKIEAGKLDIDHRTFELHSLIDQVCQMLSEKAAQKSLELVEWVDADVPNWVVGDDLRLRQVLFNLIGNAVKFTDSGHVTVRVRRQAPSPAGHCRLCIEVFDTGIGISHETLGRLFQAFEQADQSTTRRHGGTGLGLAISRRLVQLMGGEITAQSTPGTGSVFRVELVLQQATPPTPDVVATLDGKPYRVLVVDDNADARTALLADLAVLGFTAHGVADGVSALQYLSLCLSQPAAQPSQRVDVCLIDWRMPGMDGLELAQRIQALGLEKPPRLLLVSAYGTQISTEKLLQHGFCGLMSKPVSLAHLREHMLNVLQIKADSAGTVNSPGTGSETPDVGAGASTNAPDWTLHAGRNILLAEDNTLNQEVATQLLNVVGLPVVLAHNGVEALQILQGQDDIALVLMDVHMPLMDGMACTRAIREMPGYRDLPVLAMTASVLGEDRQRCTEAGMNDFIAKPVEPEQFYATLWQWLQQTPRRVAGVPRVPGVRSTALSASTDEAARRDAVLTAHWGRVMGLRVDAGLKTVNGNLSLYGRLITRFVESHAGDVAMIEQAVVNGYWDQIRDLAHVLKSTAGSIGARKLAALADEFQTQGRQSPVSQRTRMALQLAQELALLHKDLERALSQLPRSEAPPADKPLPDLAVQALQTELRTYLQEQDMAALRWVREHGATLKTHWGEAAQPMLEAVQRFDYAQALRLLDGLESASH